MGVARPPRGRQGQERPRCAARGVDANPRRLDDPHVQWHRLRAWPGFTVRDPLEVCDTAPGREDSPIDRGDALAAEILDGKALAQRIRRAVAAEVAELTRRTG